MGSITSAGIGSGLDINSIVTQLVEAETAAPAARLDRRQSSLELRLSAYGQLNSNLSSLSSSLTSLKLSSTFNSSTVSSSDSSIFTATAANSSSIVNSNFDIDVTTLAETQKLSTDPALAGAQFTNVTDTLSTGVLTFNFGTTTYNAGSDTYGGFVQNDQKAAATVTITDPSLEGVRNAINDADIGVTASLIFDGTYFRLALSADDTGANNSLEITVSDNDGNNDDATGLSLLAFNATSTNLEQNDAAVDASLTVNGIAITSNSNTVSGAIEGINLSLNSIGSASLTTEVDKAGVKSAITQFVASYNGYIGAVNQLTDFDPGTRVAGELNGDGITRSITSNLQRLLGNPVGGQNDSITILAEIGITTNPEDGRFQINDAVLDAQLENNFDAFISLFAAFGENDDPNTTFVSSNANTAVGNYAVNITTLATQGSLVASAAANLTITSASNDVLDIDINGISSTVTLAAGTYTAAELVTELRAKINSNTAFVNAGLTVDVTESAGVLTITSQSFGSESNVTITGGSGSTDLVGASAVSSSGVDVAGTIGGLAATGSGQLLTGNGVAEGLILSITGTGLGSRGEIDFKRGYADQVSSYISSLLSADGFFRVNQTSIENRLETVADDRNRLADRLISIEARLRARFGALDALIAQLRSTSSFLTEQLANLPTIGRSNRR